MFEHLTRKIGSLFPITPGEGIHYWRERILFALLGTGISVGVFVLLFSLPVIIRQKMWILLVIDLSAFATAVFVTFARPLRYEVRALATLALIYIVSIVIIHHVGVLSGGPIWLFGFAVTAGLLLGLRAAIIALAVTAATSISLLLLFFEGILETRIVQLMSTEQAIAAVANYILFNSIIAVSAAILVEGLHSTVRKKEAAADALKKEKSKLLETESILKKEVLVRVKSEQELHESERKYRLLTESISDVIWTLDMEFNFTYVSPAVEKILGWSAVEVRHLSLDQILAPQSYELAMNIIAEQMATGEASGDYNRTQMLELELQRKDGTTTWSEITASFILNDNRRPVGILGVLRDISERRKALAEKEDLQRKLERSKKMEAIGTLAGGVAHDLNNILSGILSYPELLLLDLPADSPLRKPIETIKESGKKAAAIVQDMLTLARRGVAVADVVNLNDIVNTYMASPELKKLVHFHPAVSIDIRLDPCLMNILGSPVHLGKTLMNLVSNAAEAMPDGGKLTIETQNRYVDSMIDGFEDIAEGDYVVLVVSDTGTGIAGEEISRIFEPFYTKKVMGRSGTGLGMAVVWGTVQDHQGKIQVDSRPGAGTVFSIYFPVTGEQPLRVAESDSLETIKGKGEKILVVDDVKEQREIAAQILAHLGYSVAVVSSGEEAIDYLRSHSADLVVLDMIMPAGMDGLQTYKRIKQIHRGQKAVITSGFSESKRVLETQALGAGEYVRKPYTIQTIGVAIKSELGKPSEQV
jgi:PAS domain S-box-containing protein